jgi:hypothetical protein
MTRRPRASAKRLLAVRRVRGRRPAVEQFTERSETSCVNAAVVFIDPFPATGTPAWLEPEARRDLNSTDGQF